MYTFELVRLIVFASAAMFIFGLLTWRAGRAMIKEAHEMADRIEKMLEEVDQYHREGNEVFNKAKAIYTELARRGIFVAEVKEDDAERLLRH